MPTYNLLLPDSETATINFDAANFDISIEVIVNTITKQTILKNYVVNLIEDLIEVNTYDEWKDSEGNILPINPKIILKNLKSATTTQYKNYVNNGGMLAEAGWVTNIIMYDNWDTFAFLNTGAFVQPIFWHPEVSGDTVTIVIDQSGGYTDIQTRGRILGGTYSAWSSTLVYSGLADGVYEFQVRSLNTTLAYIQTQTIEVLTT
jgi:hypothetical protein